MGRAGIALLNQRVGQINAGHGRYFVFRIPLDESLQGRLVAGRLLLAKRLVVGEDEPRQVGVQEGRLVFVPLMESQQVLVKADRLDHGRPGVGRLQVPGEKIGGGGEDRGVRGELEGVFRLRRRLFAGTVEDQRLRGEEVIKRRPIAVRQRPLFQQVVVLRNGDFLQCRRPGKGRGVVLVDLGEEPRQVPGGEVLPRRGGRGCPVHEPPAVPLEVVPIPVGENDFHHRPHFRRGLGDFRLQADDLFLRVIALDHAFEGDLAADGLDRLGIGLFLDCPLDDGVQTLDRGLGQAVINRLVHRFPLGFPFCSHRSGP